MAILSNNIAKDALELYQGYDRQEVGLGLINPSIYATPEYNDKKIQKLMIGGMSSIVYSGMEHDTQPLIIPIVYEAAYSTALAYNLRYIPLAARQAIVKYILDSNVARINSGQPIIVDYYGLKRAIPVSQYIVRRYKTIGIRVVETYPLIEWPRQIARNSTWQNHYKKFIPRR